MTPVNGYLAPRVIDFEGLSHQLHFHVDPNVGLTTSDPDYEPVPFSIKDFIPIGFDMYIGFGRGRIDKYCAYVARLTPQGWRCAAAKDEFYFSALLRIGEYFSKDDLLLDVQQLLHSVGSPEHPSCNFICRFGVYWPDPTMVNWIRMRAKFYKNAQVDCELIYLNVMMHIYMGMIAETMKKWAKAGALIKMLGVDDILNRGLSVEDACTRTCRNSAESIIAECADRGYHY